MCGDVFVDFVESNVQNVTNSLRYLLYKKATLLWSPNFDIWRYCLWIMKL